MRTARKELPIITSVAMIAVLTVLIYVFTIAADDGKNADANPPSPASNVLSTPNTVTNALPAAEGGGASVSTNSSTNSTEEVIAKIPPDFSALGLRPELEEIVRMAQSGVSEDIIVQYINQSTNSYTNLTASEIITLNDLGVPHAVISAMMKKSGKSEQDIQKIAEERMIVSITNETITATREGTGNSSQMQVAPSVQPTNQVQVGQIQTQIYTQTVYVPVQTEQPQVVVQQQPVVLQQPIPQTVVVYYNYLSPYGSWLYIDGYGYCWQPTVAVINPWWRPYYHGGRWIWTDYGWYWLSDYSWGWAAFHYGRWHYHHRCGWVWIPDTVWGPAWVSWRVTPTYCGWAPLPPHAYYHAGIGFVYHGRHVDVHFDFGLTDWHYTFVSWHHFHRRDFHRDVLPRDRVRPIYENSTVINNYIIGNNNNVVINAGVGTDHISRLTREEVKKVVVRDVPPQGVKPLYSERLVKEGNNIVLYRPSPQTPLIAKTDSQPIKPPVAMPVKYTTPEKANIPTTKTAVPSIPEQKVLSESAKPKTSVPVPSIPRYDGIVRTTPVEREPIPASRKAVEPIRPNTDIARTPISSTPSRPVLPLTPETAAKNDGEKLVVPTRGPEVAKAEVPKTLSQPPPQTSPGKETLEKNLVGSKPTGIRTTPILPNHGLTAETYGSARQNPIVSPSAPAPYSPPVRLRSPSPSTSTISPPNTPLIDRDARMRQEIATSRPSIAGENRVQPLPAPSTVPVSPREETRTPLPSATTPSRTVSPQVQPIAPMRPAENSSGTVIQPGGIKFTPLPTPQSAAPSPSYSPPSRSIAQPSPPQAPSRNFSTPYVTPKYEAPKPSFSPSSQTTPPSLNVAPTPSIPRGVPSAPPSMPSSPPSSRSGKSGDNR